MLIRQLRFSEAEQKLRSIEAAEPDYFMAQYILLENYLAQTDFIQAGQVCRQAMQSLSPDDDLHTSFKLRHQLMLIQTYEVDDFHAAIKTFQEAAQQAGAGLYNKALAHALHGRAILLGISFGIVSASEKQIALQLLRQAADIFRQDRNFHDCTKELLQLASSLKSLPFADPDGAASVYKALQACGEKEGDRLVTAEAALGMAELDFDNAFKADAPEKLFGQITKAFEKATEAFKAGGHLIPDALVKKSLGTLLLKYGIAEGLDYLEDAIAGYQQHGFFAEAQVLNRQIAGWHLEHGNTARNAEAESKAAALDKESQINLSIRVSCLARIERAFREGRIDEARRLYEEASTDFRNHPLQGQLESLQANSLGKIGLHEESTSLFRQIAERAAPLGVSAFLSDAYTNLAANLKDSNPAEAATCIAKAIGIDEQLGDMAAKLQHIQLFIQILTRQQLLLHGLPLIISPAIDTCFNECFTILKDDRTLKAAIGLGQTLQSKAMVFFLAGRIDDALKTYETAESVLKPQHLNSHLAFLYGHMGMTLIGKARKEKSIVSYDHAIERLNGAKSLFEQAGLKEEQARMSGLTGISYMEVGRLDGTYESALQRWQQAESHYEKAYSINRFLRIHSDHSTALAFSRQQSMIAFGEGSQLYTEQAFYMHLTHTKNTALAIKWLERMKAQALLTALELRRSTDASVHLQENIEDTLINSQDEYEAVATHISEKMPDDTLIVQYFYSQQTIYIFGIRKQWKEPRLTSLPFNLESLNDCIEMHFSAAYGNVRSMLHNGMEDQWQQFRYIIQAAEEWSVPGELICFIPHGVLHQLPLHTLRTSGGDYLAQRNPTIYNQSLSVLLYQTTENHLYPQSPSHKNYVFGNSRGNLDFAALEAKAVAAILGTQPALEQEVTRNNILAILPAAAILHISGHGELSNSGGWNNGLQMAGEDMLTATDIFPCKTDASLIVLSGCDTGVSEYRAGDELTGLVRSFLHAGARHIIVSLWKIDDTATAGFYTTFYTNLTNHPQKHRAVVLQETMCAQAAEGKNFFYWGAFQLIGNLV